LVFVDAWLDVPAGEVTTKRTRKSAGTESADRRALPETVVDMKGFK